LAFKGLKQYLFSMGLKSYVAKEKKGYWTDQTDVLADTWAEKKQ
jgi:hypothetical protein